MIFNPTELSHSPYTVCAEADNKLKQVESLAILRWENQPEFDSITNYQPEKELFVKPEKKFASSGNRTRAARVAGEHSTTEPTMLDSKCAV